MVTIPMYTQVHRRLNLGKEMQNATIFLFSFLFHKFSLKQNNKMYDGEFDNNRS